jgi:cytochrome c oxidase assembly protein subunit 15
MGLDASRVRKLAAMRLSELSPRAYRRLTLLALLLLGAIIVTGAAVRLSGSGLGCRDWPNCEPGELIGVGNPNQRIEQINRLFTGLVCLVVIAAVLGSRRRVPRRDDLTTLSWVLVAGVVFQAILGGIAVKVKLAPVSVMGHFLASIVLLGFALVLHHRAAEPERPARMVPVVSDSTRLLARAVFALTIWVLIAGTLVTAAGPHGGDASAKRLSWPIPDVARLHGASVDLLLLSVVVLAWRLHHDRAPRRALSMVSIFLLLGCAQAALGYIQYLNGIPVLLVGFHVAGAVLVFSAAMQLQLELTVPVRDETATAPSREALSRWATRFATTGRSSSPSGATSSGTH